MLIMKRVSGQKRFYTTFHQQDNFVEGKTYGIFHSVKKMSEKRCEFSALKHQAFTQQHLSGRARSYSLGKGQYASLPSFDTYALSLLIGE